MPAGIASRSIGPTTPRQRAKHGLIRAQLANMIKGVTDGGSGSWRSTGWVIAPRSPVRPSPCSSAIPSGLLQAAQGVGAKAERTRWFSPRLTGTFSTDRGQAARAAAPRALQGQGSQIRRRGHQTEGRQGRSDRGRGNRSQVARSGRDSREAIKDPGRRQSWPGRASA